MKEAVAANLVNIFKRSEAPVVFFCNALGDHLLSRPTILALQMIFEGRLGFVGAKGADKLFFPDVTFRVIHNIRFHGNFSFDANEFLTFRQDYDAIINLNWWDSQDMQDVIKLAPDVPLLPLCKHYGIFDSFGTNTHISDYMFKVPKLFDANLSIEKFSRFYSIDEKTRCIFDEFKRKIHPFKRVLGVHTLTRDNKQWPPGKFRKLLDLFFSQYKDFVALIVDPIDRGLDPDGLSDRIIRFENGDLSTTSSFIALCDAFVGIDSYFLHVADLARIPAVGIFGPTLPIQWGCRFTQHRHVSYPDISEVPVEEVLHALSELIQQNVSTNFFAEKQLKLQET